MESIDELIVKLKGDAGKWVVDPYLEAEEKEIEEVYEGGIIPESKGKVVPHLFIEADGTSIALQREEARRAEVKAGIAYEHWKKVSKDRYRVTEKTVYTGIMGGERFCECFSLALAKKYDLSRAGRVIVGSDGACWVKEVADLFGGHSELSKFHWKGALNQAVDNELALDLYGARIRGESDKVDKLLIQAQQKAVGDEARVNFQVKGLYYNGHFIWFEGLPLGDKA